MKKIILVGVVTFFAGAMISPVAGMAISSTRNLILGMAPSEAILTLADKIDEESGKNEEQEQKLSELNNATTQQNEELTALKKNQEIADCQKQKEYCENNIYEIQNGEIDVYWQGHLWKGSRTELINKLKEAITGWEKSKKDSSQNSRKEELQNQIDNAENNIVKIKRIMASEATEKSNLLNGECKDYLNPCE